MIAESAGALLLSEYLLDINEGADFLSNLGPKDQQAIFEAGVVTTSKKGDVLFSQGEQHLGVWIIQSGRVKSFYAGPSGREITLAYWTSGHFVGGPEVFGRGRHLWSADVLEDAELLFISGNALRELVYGSAEIGIAVIEGLVSKGKSYSALIQMLGTRSVSERLQQLLLILADNQGVQDAGSLVISRSITYEQVATIVGATRQWVTQSLDNLQQKGVLTVNRKEIVIHHPESLME